MSGWLHEVVSGWVDGHWGSCGGGEEEAEEKEVGACWVCLHT